MVEVAGIEPASEDHTQKASTCLFQYLGLTFLSSTGQDLLTAILLDFRFEAAGTPFSYPTENDDLSSPVGEVWEIVSRLLSC